MHTFIFFIVLCLIQFIYVWKKWSDIKEWHEMGSTVVERFSSGKGNGLVKKVVMPAKRATSILITFFAHFKKFLIIPIGVLMIVNFLIALIVGSLGRLIMLLF